MYIQSRKRLTDIKNLRLPKGKGKGEVQIRSMVLTDTDYYT